MKPTPARSSRGHGLVRPSIRKLHAYVPGEQPKIPGLIKLNTNENPFPPPAEVLRAVKQAVDGRLRLYPNPTAEPLRRRLAKYHRCSPDNILVGNGSDELLAMATRAFVEPAPASSPHLSAGKSLQRHVVQFFTPSYSLYPVLAEIHGAIPNPVKLNPDFSIPSVAELRAGARWKFHAALTYLTTPNAPSGRGYPTAQLDALCRAHRGVLILDEAYVDFAAEHALRLALTHPHVLVARTFSKAFSLCHLRIGYLVGPLELIAALHKIRDSYNVNGLGQVAALAALHALPYFQRNFKRIVDTREWLTDQLARLNFAVAPSQTNFILARPPRFPAQSWLLKLRNRKILVRWFDMPEVRSYLRITIGTESEARALVNACKNILARN